MRTLLKFFATLTLLLAFTSQPAAAQSKKRLVLKAPFSFTVENHTLPAGTYWLTLRDGWVQIETREGRAVMSVLTLPVANPSAAGNPRVVFHRYHDRYFLSELWPASSQRGRQTLESREEQRSRKLAAPQGIVVELEARD